MPVSSKPGVDWVEIERRVKAGEKLREIAKDYPVSHVRISQRSLERGWKGKRRISRVKRRGRKIKDWGAAVERTDTARIHGLPAGERTQGEKKVVSMSRRSPENAEAILHALSQGASEPVAASLVGIGPTTLSDWKKADPEFAELMRLAKLQSLHSAEMEIKDAGKSGDWKASQARLQANKDTRDHWGGTEQAGLSFAISINLRSDASNEQKALDPPTIEIKPHDEQEPDTGQ